MADHDWQNVAPRRSILPVVAICGAIVILLFGISAVVYVTAVGREPSQVVGLLSALAAPTILALIAIARGESNGANIDVVKRQTNGAMTAMTNRIGNVDEKVDAVNVKVERINKHVAVTGEHSFGTQPFPSAGQRPPRPGRNDGR